jgi:signal peptidase II
LNLIRTYAGLFGISGIIIALDQWTKWLARENIPFAGQWLPEGWEALAPYFRFVHWYNTGAAFGTFQGYSWVFAGLAFIVVGLIIYYYPKVSSQDWWLRLAMALQMAGAAGNLIDRLMLDGKVTDFISVGNFPVFNIADASISVGVVVLLIGVWAQERAEKASQQEEDAQIEDETPNTENETRDTQ